jgi:DNA polymerase (family 10)
MDKREIARILHEIAFFLRLRGENPYKARAYEQAGSALLAVPHAVQELLETGTLGDVKGIGPATASVITELVQAGSSAYLHEVRGSYPSTLTELGEVPGLSMKRIKRLFERAGIRSLSDLQTACRNNELLGIPGFGPKVQARLLAALGEYQRGRGYVLYADAVQEAASLQKALEEAGRIRRLTLAGAMRRKLEVINEFRFVLQCDGPRPLAYLENALSAVPNVTDVVRRSDSLHAVSLRGLPLVIVVAATPSDYGLTLLRATGHEDHLDALRQRLAEQGLPDWQAVRRRLPGATEEDIYRAAGLPYIPPELREGRGEVEWASALQRVPLLAAEQIQGFFHTHTTYSDGAGTVKDMVKAAMEAGYRYIGISDHSQSAFYANGLKEPEIRAQWLEIDRVQKKYPDIHIFKGIEADILPDGSMDYPDTLLAEFDFVIASVHSRFNLPEEQQTRRICRALRNPYVTMLGHPTGRLLLSRAGYRVDVHTIVTTAAAHRKIIEINGSRHRLDLDWRWARIAREQGVKFCVNPDAHAVSELINVELGVNVARKGGLGSADVVNTLPPVQMKTVLASR